MFDRGLVSVAEDRTILVSRNKVPSEVVERLVAPGRRLCPPRDARDAPHTEALRWHREHVFGQVDMDGRMPWG